MRKDGSSLDPRARGNRVGTSVRCDRGYGCVARGVDVARAPRAGRDDDGAREGSGRLGRARGGDERKGDGRAGGAAGARAIGGGLDAPVSAMGACCEFRGI